MSDSIFMQKLPTVWPEIIMAIGACACMLAGISRQAALRQATTWIAAAALVIAGIVAMAGSNAPSAIAHTTTMFIKPAIVVMGLILLLVAAPLPLVWRAQPNGSGPFDPSKAFHGEFLGFFLFSLTGVMLCAGANDLVWLFLALELTSLPTYVMVSISRDRMDAQEAAVKYFFLGAMAAAVFLYGFALIYGATGTTQFFSDDPKVASIARSIEQFRSEGLPPLLITGLTLSLLGIAFKIAAVPMHFYTADVYQGSATPVTAFLAFVPKTAGFVSMIVILTAVGQQPKAVWLLLWIMAALTMTVGNVLGLLQSNVKRLLAYSSIAHSGYMLVGLLRTVPPTDGSIGDGVAAVLFYLVAYGVSTVGAFAVLACLRAKGEEAQTFDDISGLSSRHPGLAAVMLISVLSLIGLPPLVGFLGKIYLFGTAIEHGFVFLVVIAVLNSAISTVYYLHIIGVCYFGRSETTPEAGADELGAPATVGDRTGSIQIGAAVSAATALVLGLAGGWLVDAAKDSSMQAAIKMSQHGVQKDVLGDSKFSQTPDAR